MDYFEASISNIQQEYDLQIFQVIVFIQMEIKI